MASLKDYMWEDSGDKLSFESLYTLKDDSPMIVNGARLHATVHFILSPNVVFVSWHINQSTNGLDTYKIALDRTLDVVKEGVSSVGLKTIATNYERSMDSRDLGFGGRAFLYGENELTPAEEEELYNYGRSIGITPHFRGPKYLVHKTITEPPLAFISHSSTDKDSIAGPIAEGLSTALCPVWYDEYSLKVGDRLRESIEKGIRECKICIVIITPNYLKNIGWARTEFDAVFSKEHIFQEDSILPVWSGVTPREVYEYSPSMANRVALNLDSLGIEKVISSLHVAIQNKNKEIKY